jgi:hypothetical protein
VLVADACCSAFCSASDSPPTKAVGSPISCTSVTTAVRIVARAGQDGDNACFVYAITQLVIDYKQHLATHRFCISSTFWAPALAAYSPAESAAVLSKHSQVSASTHMYSLGTSAAQHSAVPVTPH